MTDFKFCKDQWGVHVYYVSRDENPSIKIDSLMINDNVEFDCSRNCVVPPVKKISAINQDTKVEMSYTFEVVDIEYPADERLVPMRHLVGTPVNYFSVDGTAVAVNMLNTLCQNAGLTKKRNGTGAREYHMNDYGGNDIPNRISIEGMNCSEPFHDIKLNQLFTAHKQECREYINDIEVRAREAVDIWLLAGRTAKGLTVGFLINHLALIEGRVHSIRSMKKTQHEHRLALESISRMVSEIKVIGMQALINDEEKSNEELDNDSL